MVNGLPPVAITQPGVPAFGAGDPAGKAKTCQAVPVGLVQLTRTEVVVIFAVAKAVGLGQVGNVVKVTGVVTQTLGEFTEQIV